MGGFCLFISVEKVSTYFVHIFQLIADSLFIMAGLAVKPGVLNQIQSCLVVCEISLI